MYTLVINHIQKRLSYRTMEPIIPQIVREVHRVIVAGGFIVLNELDPGPQGYGPTDERIMQVLRKLAPGRFMSAAASANDNPAELFHRAAEEHGVADGLCSRHRREHRLLRVHFRVRANRPRLSAHRGGAGCLQRLDAPRRRSVVALPGLARGDSPANRVTASCALTSILTREEKFMEQAGATTLATFPRDLAAARSITIH